MRRLKWCAGLVVLGFGCLVGMISFGPVSAGAAKADPPPAPSFENAKGYAIHIACETVDPKHYGDGVPDLPATVDDRDFMAALSKALGYEHLAVLSAKAEKKGEKSIRETVLAALDAAAKKANGANGDIVFVTYSGHGGQVRDEGPNPDENDEMDETWCLYDGMLIDDEVGVALSKFQKGVRVVFVFDSCHSETAAKGMQLNAKNFDQFATEKGNQPDAKSSAIIDKIPSLKEKLMYTEAKKVGGAKKVSKRALKREKSLDVYAKHKAFYKDLATKFNNETVVRDPRKLSACVITLSACRDSQTALDLGTQGLYTRELKGIWKDGTFGSDYNEFQKQVKDQVFTKAQDPELADEDGTPHLQEPQLTFAGAVPSFANQKLFRIK